MARINNTDKLAKLQEQMAKLAAQARDLQAREKDKERKNDTRRKVIAGALALEHLEKNPGGHFATQLVALLNEYVTRSADRALFPVLADMVSPADNGAKGTTGSEKSEAPAAVVNG